MLQINGANNQFQSSVNRPASVYAVSESSLGQVDFLLASIGFQGNDCGLTSCRVESCR